MIRRQYPTKKKRKILFISKEIGTGRMIDDEIVDDRLNVLEAAEGIVNWYNNTLRKGERPRKVVKIVSVEPSMTHTWLKANLVTESKGGRIFDRYKCSGCGITGRRYGLDFAITLDKKYKADKYKECKGE